MNCEYWKDIVQQLRDINRCNWASHVLSTDLPSETNLRETNLGAALECFSQEEIIEATIYAYRDWSAQPYCDLILEQFDINKILSVFHSIETPDSDIKLGVERLLEILREQT